MDIKKLSTQRLLEMYRKLRKELFILSVRDDDNPETYDQRVAETQALYQQLDVMKCELDTREHLPHKRRGKNVVSKNIVVRRK